MPRLDLDKITAGLPKTWSGFLRDWDRSLRYTGDKLQHMHIAGSFNHKGSSGLRYIVNTSGTTARVHQHLDSGQGEVDWNAFFGTLREDSTSTV